MLNIRLFPYLYHIYTTKAYPKIFRVKGSTRLKQFLSKLATINGKKYGYPDKTVLDEDWDYLIIIDACRHDLYEEVEGFSDSIISQGSSTMEWRDRTFKKGEKHDIIYISTNPFISKIKFKQILGYVPFFHLEELYLDEWDEKLGTILPEKVTEKAILMAQKYPNKKMIIHYLQPHIPFIGKKKVIYNEAHIPEDLLGYRKILWDALALKELTKKDVWEGYRENLKLVLTEVHKLSDKLNGKVILTSDHGNGFGEYSIFGHPEKLRIEELVKVPWVVLKE